MRKEKEENSLYKKKLREEKTMVDRTRKRRKKNIRTRGKTEGEQDKEEITRTPVLTFSSLHLWLSMAGDKGR